MTEFKPIIEARKLSIVKNRRTILADLDLKINDRSLTFIVGPNGAGKTTLLRAFAAIEPDGTLSTYWRGTDPINSIDDRTRSQRISWLPQRIEYSWEFSALEAMVMGRYPFHQGLPSAVDIARCKRAAEFLHCDAFLDKPLSKLSAGERQKIMIARILATDAELLLLDQPAANLDIDATFHLYEVLKLLAKERAIVVVDHDLSCAFRYADRIVIIANGTIATEGPPEEALSEENILRWFRVKSQKWRSPLGAAELFIY